MAGISQVKREVVKAKLRFGTKPKDIAEQVGVDVQTVYTIKQKLDKEIAVEAVKEAATIPTELVTNLVEEAKKTLPLPTPSGVSDSLDAVVSGLDGLKLLDKGFQTTIGKVLARFDAIADDEDTPLKDLKLIIDTSANAHEKIFSSGTNIHIGDNNSQSNNQLTVFKNKQGV